MSADGRIVSDKSHLTITREVPLPGPDVPLDKLEEQRSELLALNLDEAAQKVQERIDSLSGDIVLTADEVGVIDALLQDSGLGYLGMTVDESGVHFTDGESGRPRYLAAEIAHLVRAVPGLVYNGVVETDGFELPDYRRLLVEDNRVTEQVPDYIVWRNA